MSRKLLPLVLLVLALLGGIAWLVVRGGGARGLERADNPKVEIPGDSRAQLSSESRPLEARGAEPGSKSTANTSASTGTGTLRIRVLDERTRAPVAELPFLVHSERGGDQELAHGKTDPQGRAEVRDLEPNTILVRTGRRPPYAESTGALWLIAGATQELEILVGPGSTVTGRIVDDLGAPVAGAALYLDFASRSLEPPEPDTRSAADGRFRLENVSCRPRGVWVVDGEMRPESWRNVQLTATRDDVRAIGWAAPTPGKDVDAGDIVLARAVVCSGRVIDALDRPVAGALVSLRSNRRYARDQPLGLQCPPELARGPRDPEFHLYSRETLSDEAGRFELRAQAGEPWVVVWTREDQVQDFFLPEGKPGERVDGVELKLKGLMNVELELVDAAGAPATIPAAVMLFPGLEPAWRSNDLFGGRGVSALARASNTAQAHAEISTRDPDGRWRLQLLIDPGSIGELVIAACGYEPISERSASGFPALVRRRLELHECPCFHLRLVAKDPAAKLLDPPGGRIRLHVCRASPERHRGAMFGCCGFGARWNDDWRGDPLALVLPVRRKDSFWIYARAQGPHEQRWYEFTDVASFGPFEPGPEVRELALDPATFVRAPKADPSPPAPSAPGGEAKARLRGSVGDAATGKALARTSISFEEPGVESPWGRKFSRMSNDSGEFADEALPVGRWVVRVAHPGYMPAELGERESRSGETLEIGSIALEPYPVHRGRVITADGKAPARADVQVVDASVPMPEENRYASVEPDGSFELFGELPPKLVLQVAVIALGDGRGADAQRFVLESWPVEEFKELRLAPSRRVVVTLAGIDPEEAVLQPYVCPAPGEPASTCDHRTGELKEHVHLAEGIEIDSSAQGQRYVFLLAPGRYQVWGANLVHDLVWTEFDVTPGDSDLERTLGVR